MATSKKEENLSQDGNARVSGDARVYGDADYIVIGPVGSRNDFTTFYKTENNIEVKCRCFTGNIDDFSKKVEETHKDNIYAKQYKLAIELAKIKILKEEN